MARTNTEWVAQVSLLRPGCSGRTDFQGETQTLRNCFVARVESAGRRAIVVFLIYMVGTDLAMMVSSDRWTLRLHLLASLILFLTFSVHRAQAQTALLPQLQSADPFLADLFH